MAVNQKQKLLSLVPLIIATLLIVGGILLAAAGYLRSLDKGLGAINTPFGTGVGDGYGILIYMFIPLGLLWYLTRSNSLFDPLFKVTAFIFAMNNLYALFWSAVQYAILIKAYVTASCEPEENVPILPAQIASCDAARAIVAGVWIVFAGHIALLIAATFSAFFSSSENETPSTVDQRNLTRQSVDSTVVS
eukprot:TRINITY_DN1856_c0_g1_i1.p1 TRINITY_DN1856_c0_g1~~TRINITY_DN1856_c0_g1_i1.p1  ORF type:complete len:191 (+),score=40.87 TRINITY_DN1856_c0_g1_i1:50-622(+)